MPAKTLTALEAQLHLHADTSVASDRTDSGWVRCTIFERLDLADSQNSVQSLTQELGGIQEEIETTRQVSVECEVPKKPTDPSFVVLKGAYANRTTLAVALMDGGLATSEGRVYPMRVFGFNEARSPRDGYVKVSMTFRVVADDDLGPITFPSV